jgi:uncharacterized membrane protein
VATAPTPGELAAFSGRPALPPIRVYVGEQVEADDFDAAAALALREMDRTGAWHRKVINLVGTTGSGWVDRNIPTPLEYMHGGDTATVALQYSYLPSWISFLVDKERAGHAARALYQAVHARLLTIPADRRPQLVLSGESLGSYALDAVFATPQSLIDGADGVFFEGPPAASRIWQQIVAHRDAGSPAWRPVYQGAKSIRFGQWPNTDLRYPWDAPWQLPRVVYLQNATDPVVWWTPDLLFDKPAWASPRLGPDVTPQLRYYPIVSFWQTTVDLAVSFGMPVPHGHSYGIGACVGWAGALLPATRSLFTDQRYASLTAAQVAMRVFIDVPFATVLAEEVAFRGVLFGLALRLWPPLGATAFSALMFGCWHILSSLHLNTKKPALTSLLGPSELGAALADLGTVVFTGLGGALFCELRRRSGSLLVPISFHWATNALGYAFGFLLRVGVIPKL